MKYRKADNMLDDLRGLVSIPSISIDSNNVKYPFGLDCHRALEYCLNLCQKYGMRVKRCGNYLGYAEIGEGDSLMGILVHVDVVPSGEGWHYEPFALTETAERIFGRGVIDDKGPAILCIHAMKDVLQSGSIINKRVRLIFGCSEENGNWKDMDYYKAKEELPNFGFTADGDFPVVHAEKGMLQLELSMDVEKSGLLSANGGIAPNIVPSVCSLSYLDKGKTVTVTEQGISTHGSTPREGINAIGLAMQKAKGKFAEFYNECIGMSWNGKNLDCCLHDEVSGDITISPGMLRMNEGKVRLILDIRYPISFDADDVISRISKRTELYDIAVKVLGHEEPIYMDKNEHFIQNMLKVYQSITGDMSEPIVMGGGTYAKAMANIVAFGPNFPGATCTEHQPDETATIEDLYKAREIYRRVIEVC
ncbi:MAG: Sapep family Mn(2+)-dependent dipeptidase [Peptostreptococcaceae bacterium]|nr:Sapep family Mn(2+)-dependent dipeptidase [Peptostreptococcaceae bacterium]